MATTPPHRWASPPFLGRFPAKQFQGLPANTQHSSEPPQTPQLWPNPRSHHPATICRARPTSSGRTGSVSRMAIMEGKGPNLLRVAPTRRSITTYPTVKEDTKGLRSSHARLRSTPMLREILFALVLLVPDGRYAALLNLDEHEPNQVKTIIKNATERRKIPHQNE